MGNAGGSASVEGIYVSILFVSSAGRSVQLNIGRRSWAIFVGEERAEPPCQHRRGGVAIPAPNVRSFQQRRIIVTTPTNPVSPIVSRDEWLRARRELLTQEKALTRQYDAVAAARRSLPWVRVRRICIRHAGRKADAFGAFRRTEPTDRSTFHVRSGLEGGFRRLLVRIGPRGRSSRSPQKSRRHVCCCFSRPAAAD